jgi:hypothetical protein
MVPANNTDPVMQIDFTLSGEIQKSAIIYFTWENLFGAQYVLSHLFTRCAKGISVLG